jgi:hypothetical protein
LDGALKHSKSFGVYVVMSRADGKNIIWPALEQLDSMFKLGLKFKSNSGDIVCPNGSVILIRGAGSRREIDKIRGLEYSAGCVVDEAQGFGSNDLKYLINDVLQPATLKHNAKIGLGGTPNAACAGYFFEATTDDNGPWSKHHWTILENPHYKNTKTILNNIRRDNNWNEYNSVYRREYLGEWVRDVKGLIYSFNVDVNTVPTFPKDLAKDWGYVLGIDLGFNDPTAFVVIAYSKDLAQAFVVESFKESSLIPSAAAVEIEKLYERYPLEKIVADTGGFGKGYAEEWKRKYYIPVQAANKTNKLAYIQLMNGEFASRQLSICADKNQDLIDELSLLQWDSDKLVLNIFQADRRFSDHLTDALLYGWREAYHHAGDWEKEVPKVNSKEWLDQEEERLWEGEMLKLENPQTWWEDLWLKP